MGSTRTKLPQSACPVGGLVPWMNTRCPIASCKPHPVFGWLYVLHEKRNTEGLVIWVNVSQEEIVEAMRATARYAVGDLVELGPCLSRRIRARKWNFSTGSFTYLIEGAREGRDFAMDEAQLTERIRAAAERPA